MVSRPEEEGTQPRGEVLCLRPWWEVTADHSLRSCSAWLGLGLG